MASVLDNLAQATHRALKPGASIGDVTGMSQAISLASVHFRDGTRTISWSIFGGLLMFGIVVAGGMVISVSLITKSSLESLETRVQVLEREAEAAAAREKGERTQSQDDISLTEL
eukprot:m.228157 g.228157  ORF g.228157 m.228157 type:complete len:115 (-) comp25970_c0_seq1:3987-4331(-)